MSSLIDDFCDYYQELHLDSLCRLHTIYSEQIVFKDPLHTIQGLNNITLYFEQMITNITHCRFAVDKIVTADDQAFVTWIMNFAHPKLNHGHSIELPGTSHLQFHDTIFYQQDYYDLGHMIYEQIPILSYIIHKIKSRISI